MGERIKELLFNFHIEQDELVRLQDKTVARLHFIEGALFVLEALEKESTNGE